MDTFSTSVSSFKVPTIHPAPRQIHRFKTPNSVSHLSTAATSTAATSAKPTSTSFSHPKLTTSPFSSHPQSTQPFKTSTPLKRNAASGYAAALIDAAICNNSLEAIERDVRRLLKWLRHNEELKTIMADPFVGEGEKGRVIKEVVEMGRFRLHLVVLVKLLVEKNKMDMVGEVLDEFGRIYDELSGTLRSVFVPSKKKIEAFG